MDHSNKSNSNKSGKIDSKSNVNKELNEILCCSNISHSNTKTEQLSEEEVTILWLKIKQNI